MRLQASLSFCFAFISLFREAILSFNRLASSWFTRNFWERERMSAISPENRKTSIIGAVTKGIMPIYFSHSIFLTLKPFPMGCFFLHTEQTYLKSLFLVGFSLPLGFSFGNEP